MTVTAIGNPVLIPVVALVPGTAAACYAESPVQRADTILVGGKVLTVDGVGNLMIC